MLTTPLRLGLLGRRRIGRDLSIDLFGEIGVIGERRLNLLAPQAEHLDRPSHTLANRHVASDEPADHLPDIGTTDQRSPTAGWAVPEAHQRMPANPEPLIDQLLRQG